MKGLVLLKKKILTVLPLALAVLLLASCGSGAGRLSPEQADNAYDWAESELLGYVLDEYGAEAVLEYIYRAYDDDVVLEHVVSSRALEDILWEYRDSFPSASADRALLRYISRNYRLDDVARYY